MDLIIKIKEILELEKFNNLSKEDKEIVFESIFANCLILSNENQERFLRLINDRLISIENLKSNSYYKDNICYGGIVESKVVGPAINEEETIFPCNYFLKYREYYSPLGRLTKSILHEFGHMVVKKDSVDLSDNGNVYIDMGGLVISRLLEDEYGHMFTEIINEFTNFLSYKSHLSYSKYNMEAENKMKEFAERIGLSYESNAQHLNVLPEDIFTSYTEESLSTETLEDGTTRMFNHLYTKYTPLVKLIMHSFQNPIFTQADLNVEFKKGNGLSATIDNIPINDLLYGYYESPFHPQQIFDGVLAEQGLWEKFCVGFDNKMMDSEIDMAFVESSIEQFSRFYQKRISMFLSEGKITENVAQSRLEEYYKTVGCCQSYYSQIKGKAI